MGDIIIFCRSAPIQLVGRRILPKTIKMINNLRGSNMRHISFLSFVVLLGLYLIMVLTPAEAAESTRQIAPIKKMKAVRSTANRVQPVKRTQAKRIRPRYVALEVGKTQTVLVPGLFAKQALRVTTIPSRKQPKIIIIKGLTIQATSKVKDKVGRYYKINVPTHNPLRNYQVQYRNKKGNWATVPPSRLQLRMIRVHDITKGQSKAIWIPGKTKIQVRLASRNKAVQGTKATYKGLNTNKTQRKYYITTSTLTPTGTYPLQYFNATKKRWYSLARGREKVRVKGMAMQVKRISNQQLTTASKQGLGTKNTRTRKLTVQQMQLVAVAKSQSSIRMSRGVYARLARTNPNCNSNNNHAPPFIVSVAPGKTGFVGTEIVFNGQNLVADDFVAWIGNKALTITYRSATQIKASLPNTRMVGDLIVGYCTQSSNYPLETTYRVYGEPVIQSVSPTSFARGDKVTVTGLDLDFSGALEGTSYRPTPNHYVSVLLHNTSTSNVSGNQVLPHVRIRDLEWSNDGKSFTFSADAAYKSGIISPQPTSLSGKLRLIRAESYGTVDLYTVVSPQSVSWNSLPPLAVTEFKGNPYSDTDFLIMCYACGQIGSTSSLRYPVYVSGRGFFEGTTARIGSIDVTDSFNLGRDSSGHSLKLHIPPETQSGLIVISRGDSTVQTSTLKIVSEPTFMPATLEMMGDLFTIEIGKTYDLRGWNLKPSGISGLSYRLDIRLQRHPSLQLEILQHNANLIQFRVNATGSLDSSDQALQQLLNANDVGHMLKLTAVYNGVEKTLFGVGFVKYRLAMPSS